MATKVLLIIGINFCWCNYNLKPVFYLCFRMKSKNMSRKINRAVHLTKLRKFIINENKKYLFFWPSTQTSDWNSYQLRWDVRNDLYVALLKLDIHKCHYRDVAGTLFVTSSRLNEHCELHETVGHSYTCSFQSWGDVCLYAGPMTLDDYHDTSRKKGSISLLKSFSTSFDTKKQSCIINLIDSIIVHSQQHKLKLQSLWETN